MRFLKLLSFAIALFLGTGGFAYADSECTYQPRGATAMTASTPGAKALTHGVNISHWWEDEQDRAPSVSEIRQIYENSFDFIRLPISPKWLEIENPQEQQEKLTALRCDIVSILNEGLSVVLDLHPSQAFQAEVSRNPNEAVPRVEDAWRKLASVLYKLPPERIFVSIYNEPLVESELWWRIQERILDDLRPLFPSNTFIVSSGPFDGWWQIIEKKPYRDTNIIYDFHFYDPMAFTHHGADWLKPGEQSSSPIVYPVTKKFAFDMDDPVIKKYVDENWDRTAVTKIIGQVVAWKDYNSVRVACLEFGVYAAQVDDLSRYNWLRDVHDALEAAHIPWAVWEYRGGFGIVDKQGDFDKTVAHALDLKPNKLP